MAILEKYVSSLAAGGGTGLTAGSPLTWAEMVTAINAGTEAGSRFNVKADGTYARTTTTDAVTGGGSTTSPVVIRGYATTIGDGYQGRANSGTGALVTTNMPSVTYTTGRWNGSGTFVFIEAINFSGATTSTLLALGGDSGARACKASNTGAGASANAIAAASGSRATVYDCDATAAGSAATVNVGNANSRVIACRVRNTGTGPGVQLATSSGVVLDSVLYRCGGAGVLLSAAGFTGVVARNTIVGNTSDGVTFTTGTTGEQQVYGNLITDNGGYGINAVSAAGAILAALNRLDRNTSGPTNGGTDWFAATGYGHNTTSVTQAQEYQDAASDDYRLLATSPAASGGPWGTAAIGAIQRAAGGVIGVIGNSLIRGAN